MHFLLSHFLGELLVLLLGDSLMFHTLEELLDVLQAILTGVLGIEVVVEARDGSLSVELSLVLDLSGATIGVLGLGDDLRDCTLSRGRTY